MLKPSPIVLRACGLLCLLFIGNLGCKSERSITDFLDDEAEKDSLAGRFGTVIAECLPYARFPEPTWLHQSPQDGLQLRKEVLVCIQRGEDFFKIPAQPGLPVLVGQESAQPKDPIEYTFSPEAVGTAIFVRVHRMSMAPVEYESRDNFSRHTLMRERVSYILSIVDRASHKATSAEILGDPDVPNSLAGPNPTHTAYGDESARTQLREFISKHIAPLGTAVTNPR